MTNLSAAAMTAERRATTFLVEQLRSAERITRADLNAAMGAGFGGTDADGLWTQHDSFEILEHALTHHLQFGPYPLRRSEEHTSELQSLMRISYAVFCLNKKQYTIVMSVTPLRIIT